MTTQPAHNGLAITGLILVVTGIFSFGIAAVPGLVFFHIARHQHLRDPVRYHGGRISLTALILGYCILGTWILSLALYFL